MSRIKQVLLVLIAIELLIGAVVVGRRLARPAPPEPDWALFDSDTAAELRAAAVRCDNRAQDWQMLGELYMAEGLFVEAEMCHRVACDLEPNDANCARQWAFALERLAFLDTANAQYRRSSQLQPAVADGNAYFIGRNLLRADKLEEARAIFTEGINLEANRYELARLHLHKGELNDAEVQYKALAAARPNDLLVHLLGYRVALERGDAHQVFTRADDARYAPGKLLNPFSWESARIIRRTMNLGAGQKQRQGRELIADEHFDEARAMLTDAGRVHPHAGFNELLAEIEFRRGEYAKAVTLLEEWQTQNGPSARSATRLGDTWEAIGQPAKARGYWLRAVRAESGADLKDLHNKLAKSFAAAGDKAAADHHFASDNYYDGLDKLRIGDTKKAAECFAAATQYDAAMAQAWFYLGESRRRVGQSEAAVEAYKTCLKLNPHHGRALASLDSMVK